MTAVLKVVEKAIGQTEQRTSELRLVSQRLTARDLIAQHVANEVALGNARREQARREHRRVASFLVGIEEHPIERELNPRKRNVSPRLLDPEPETKAALAAFEGRQVVMLFDDRQIDDLSTELTVTDESQVVFLRLVPLVGG